LARYSAVTRAAVCPMGTPMPRAIGTRAVAISELLTGLRADPRNNGVVNRHENGRPCLGPASPTVLLAATLPAAAEELVSGETDMVAPVACAGAAHGLVCGLVHD